MLSLTDDLWWAGLTWVPPRKSLRVQAPADRLRGRQVRLIRMLQECLEQISPSWIQSSSTQNQNQETSELKVGLSLHLLLSPSVCLVLSFDFMSCCVCVWFEVLPACVCVGFEVLLVCVRFELCHMLMLSLPQFSILLL